MFKRLLALEENPRCQACVAAQPCIRCRRSGRPVGMITDYGPVCNSCRVHFVKPQPCQMCGEVTSRLTRVSTANGDKQACSSCATADHRSCSACGRHRPCQEVGGGVWQCRKCIELGQVPCNSCHALMPAGLGNRCQACYWQERCKHGVSQLTELMTGVRAREAFASFGSWLVSEGLAKRGTLRLRQHVEFFVVLDAAGDEDWTSAFLLKLFGTAALRSYELPVRWLAQSGVELSDEDKAREADLRRVQKSAALVPAMTPAREVIDAFSDELLKRHAVGELTIRSVRLAMKPAAALLHLEDPLGRRLPGQPALDRYLRQVPGQRAAVSAFVSFLRANRGLELRIPSKPSAGSVEIRKSLEKQIAVLVAEVGDTPEVAKRWMSLALRYFHHLSVTEAKMVCAKATPVEVDEGIELSYEGRAYWIPRSPNLRLRHSPKDLPA